MESLLGIHSFLPLIRRSGSPRAVYGKSLLSSPQSHFSCEHPSAPQKLDLRLGRVACTTYCTCMNAEECELPLMS